MNFSLIVSKNGKVIEKVRTHSLRRFTNNLRSINWQNGPLKVYLRVNYGKHKDHDGRMATFFNDGWYETEQGLWLTFRAFREGV